jgi:hypothetical protein
VSWLSGLQRVAKWRTGKAPASARNSLPLGGGVSEYQILPTRELAGLARAP